MRDTKTPIPRLVEDGALTPMRAAVDAFEWLEELAKTIREASADVDGDRQAAHLVLARISRLAAAAAYIASDTGNFIDCAREDMESKYLTFILAAAKSGKVT